MCIYIYIYMFLGFRPCHAGDLETTARKDCLVQPRGQLRFRFASLACFLDDEMYDAFLGLGFRFLGLGFRVLGFWALGFN